jgi:hypothetical protein
MNEIPSENRTEVPLGALWDPLRVFQLRASGDDNGRLINGARGGLCNGGNQRLHKSGSAGASESGETFRQLY